MPTDIIPLAVEHTEIEGLEILQMKQISDERGTVREFYRESSFLEAGLPDLYCFDQEWRPGMAGVSVNPLDPGAAIAWPLPVDASDPAQISAKDASAPGI